MAGVFPDSPPYHTHDTQGPLLSRIVYIAKTTEKLNSREEIRSHHDGLLRAARGAEGEPVTGMMIVYPNSVLHAVEAQSRVIMEFLRALKAADPAKSKIKSLRVRATLRPLPRAPTPPSGAPAASAPPPLCSPALTPAGAMEPSRPPLVTCAPLPRPPRVAAQIVSSTEDIPARSYNGHFSSFYNTPIADAYDAIDPEHLVAGVSDINLTMLKLGKQMSNLTKMEAEVCGLPSCNAPRPIPRNMSPNRPPVAHPHAALHPFAALGGNLVGAGCM